MSAAVAAIAFGEANNSILPSCRLEWGGIEAYGEEAISEAFRASPLKGDVHFVECAHACLLRVNECALFADLYDNRVGRLWRVGKASSNKPEPRLSMPFDPDLQQERGSIQFRLADHPSLDPAHAEVVVQAARTLLDPGEEALLYRARGFIIRAFSSGDKCAALVALHQLGGGQVRSNRWSYGIISTANNGAINTVADQSVDWPWTATL